MAIEYASLNSLKRLVGNISDIYQKKADVLAYSIVKSETAEEGFAASYKLMAGEAQHGATINIPKDYLVKSADILECETADQPVAGLKVGDKYIDFVVNTTEGSGNESHIYLPVQELVDAYKGDGKGIVLGADNTFSLNIDATNANGLEVGDAGLKLNLATETSAGAMSAADKVKVNAALTADDFTEISDAQIDALFTDAE